MRGGRGFKFFLVCQGKRVKTTFFTLLGWVLGVEVSAQAQFRGRTIGATV